MDKVLNYTDFYKTDHRRQYPEGTEYVYSNFTARSSRIKSIDKVVFFGLQYFIKEYLIERFNTSFFNRPKKEVIAEYKRTLDNALGKDSVSMEHMEELHDLGYLPLKIKAVPEGSKVPLGVPMLTIINTHPKFFWVTNFIESLLSNIIWGPITSATTAHSIKKLLLDQAKRSSDNLIFVDYQGHDFSFRGLMGLEAVGLSCSAHLLSFVGTDSIPAIDFLEKYYLANSDKELVGCSVPATEHSVMSLGQKDNELATYKRLITEIYPKGVVSIVSDTWNFWDVINNYSIELKEIIMNRDGKVVFRPDSGNPQLIICGNPLAEKDTPEFKGALETLWNIFGGTVNSKGFRELDSHVGLIYGDRITYDRAKAITQNMMDKGYASTNIVFGIGSYTYQFVTRDTFGMAMKATYGIVKGEGLNIFKDPITDNGIKKSAKGLLMVDENFELHQEVDVLTEQMGLLNPVFCDGKLIKEFSLKEIRNRLNDK